MKKFTVILLYPDYATDNWGQDTWMGTVEAQDTNEAILFAQRQCHADTKGVVIGLADLFVLAVIAGEHKDIKP